MARVPQLLVTRILIAAAVLLIAAFTLMPEPGGTAIGVPFCLVCGDRGGRDLFLNVLLFAPLGAALALAGMDRRRVLLLALLASTVVEALQLVVVPGRDPSVGDVAANSTGAVLAATCLHAQRWWAHPTPSRALSLTAIGAVTWVIVLAISAFALRPAPSDAAYFGQVRPDRPKQWDRFTGRVFAPSSGEAGITEGRMTPAQSAALRDSVTLAVVVLPPGDAPARLAPILAVFDAHRREIGLLAQRRDAALFRARLGADVLRLASPHIALEDVFASGGRAGCAQPDAPLVVRGTMRAGTISIAARGGGCDVARTEAIRASFGWMLVLPFDAGLDHSAAPLSALWLGGLVAVWGFWIGCATRHAGPTRMVAPVIAVAALGIGLGVVPWQAGLPHATWWEWAAALAGLALGALMGWRTEGRRKA